MCLALITAIGYSMLALAIYFNPKLQVHPLPLVMIISFVGASIFFSYFFGNEFCHFQLYKLTAATFYFRWNDPYYDFWGAVILWGSAVFLSIFLLNAMLWLNIAMAVDLICMIKYPFRPKSVKFYVLFSFASSFVVAVLNEIAFYNNYLWRYRILSIWLLLTALIYVVTATASIIYAIKQLLRPGISQEIRTVVFRRHVLSIICFIIAYAYFFMSVAIDWFKIGNQQFNLHFRYLKVLKVIFILQGVYLPLIRFIEPAFYKVLKENMRQLAIKIVFRSPEPLSEYQLICVNSLLNRGLEN